MSLAGGAVRDPASDENFRGVDRRLSTLETRILIPRVAELPTFGEKGEVLYNDADNTVYFYNGTEWKAL